MNTEPLETMKIDVSVNQQIPIVKEQGDVDRTNPTEPFLAFTKLYVFYLHDWV